MTYIDALLASHLPIASWVVVAVWPLLFSVNHFVVHTLRAVNARQSCIKVENHAVISRGSRPLWLLAGGALLCTAAGLGYSRRAAAA